MLESTRRFSVSDTQELVSCARLMTTQGVTLLQVEAKSGCEIESALAVLRRFRAIGRRVVLCDTSNLVVGRQFGSSVVTLGCAELLISCGLSGREIAIGARDAGLSLANVMVCGQAAAAGDVLASHLVAGDTALLLGIEDKVCNSLVAALDRRLSAKLAAA
ncbi:MAG: hypothetical protein MK171_10820 [Pirellulales bacterium]|nr:hypothetical protein [Pirellulales bacterium]